MEALFSCASAYPANEQILDKLAQSFNEIAELYYSYIECYLPKIAEFTFYIVYYSNSDIQSE
jgi:hypothetical protein